MEEIFEVIKAVNRLGDKITDVSCKVDSLIDAVSKNPSMELKTSYVDEITASGLIRRSPRTLLKLRRSGDLTFIRVGKKVLYSTHDLKSYLEKNCSTSSNHGVVLRE